MIINIIIKVLFAVMAFVMCLGMIGEENETDKAMYRDMCVFFTLAAAVMVAL